jgi:subtilase family serine protease
MGTTVVVLAGKSPATLGSDLRAFDQAFHLPALKFSVVSLGGPNDRFESGARGEIEVTLDTEAVHTIAPGASIVVLVVPLTTDPSSLAPQATAVRYAAAHHLGQIVTTSLGNLGEAALGTATIANLHQDFQYAAVQHLSVIDASGDFGTSSRMTLSVNGPGCCFTVPMRGYPASDPLVTAVGATRLHLDASGKRISPDTVANDPGVASGGGLSTVFDRPSYQDSLASVVGNHRGGPDISMNGDIDSGFELYGSAVTQNRSLGQGWGSVGGTSESAPLFAGIAAIADQAAGRPLGPLNPYLYRAYQLPGHGGIVPVTSGNNTVAIESSNGTPVAVPGYAATDGFNLATGLGTVDAAKLVMALTHLARD